MYKIISINSSTERKPVHGTQSCESFITENFQNLNKIHFLSRNMKIFFPEPGAIELGYNDTPYQTEKVSELIIALHNCFSQHVPLGLSADVLWYTIAHEVATHVKLNPQKYANLFTNTRDQKNVLKVNDNSLVYGEKNDWTKTVHYLYKQLKEKINREVIESFVPPFLGTTSETSAAILVNFLSTVSEYYKYIKYPNCGIPRIRFEGQQRDFEHLYNATKNLTNFFPELDGYFSDLLPVLKKIKTMDESDKKFWGSIYHFNNIAVGPEVNGWINAFFAYHRTENWIKMKDHFNWEKESVLTNTFPQHISHADFLWNDQSQEYRMGFVSGIIGSEFVDAFLVPKLVYGVVEYN